MGCMLARRFSGTDATAAAKKASKSRRHAYSSRLQAFYGQSKQREVSRARERTFCLLADFLHSLLVYILRRLHLYHPRLHPFPLLYHTPAASHRSDCVFVQSFLTGLPSSTTRSPTVEFPSFPHD